MLFSRLRPPKDFLQGPPLLIGIISLMGIAFQILHNNAALQNSNTIGMSIALQAPIIQHGNNMNCLGVEPWQKKISPDLCCLF
jgi:hypothetical protein